MEESIDLPHEIFEIIKPILENQYDTLQLSNPNILDALLELLADRPLPSTLILVDDILPKAIAKNISPRQLKILVNMVFTNKEIGEIIIKSINIGLQAYIHRETVKTQSHGRKLSSRNNCYFNFQDESSFTQFHCSKDESFIPKREFSFFSWIYPEKLEEEVCIAEFHDGNDLYLIIYITKDRRIGIKYSGTKTIFKIESEKKQVEYNQWNLIGFSLRRINKFLGKKDQLIIFINGYTPSKVDKRKNSCVYPQSEFKHLTVGYSTDQKKSKTNRKPFRGKIASLYISDKYLYDHHFFLITEFSSKLCFDYNPEIGGNKLILKEISNSLVFQWNARNNLPICNFQDLRYSERCKKIHFTSILDSIQMNGGLKIFIPLIKECNQQGVVHILGTISSICLIENYLDHVLCSNFFEILGLTLEEINLSPCHELLVICKELVNNLE